MPPTPYALHALPSRSSLAGSHVSATRATVVVDRHARVVALRRRHHPPPPVFRDDRHPPAGAGRSAPAPAGSAAPGHVRRGLARVGPARPAPGRPAPDRAPATTRESRDRARDQCDADCQNVRSDHLGSPRRISTAGSREAALTVQAYAIIETERSGVNIGAIECQTGWPREPERRLSRTRRRQRDGIPRRGRPSVSASSTSRCIPSPRKSSVGWCSFPVFRSRAWGRAGRCARSRSGLRRICSTSPGPLIYSGNSGDTAFHWIQIGWLLVVAVVLSTIWTVVDRGRPRLRRPREMDSSVRAFRARRSDVLFRNGQGHSHTVSRSIARHAGGTGRQSLANRHALDRDRLVCRLSDVHRMGGGHGRRPSRSSRRRRCWVRRSPWPTWFRCSC